MNQQQKWTLYSESLLIKLLVHEELVSFQAVQECLSSHTRSRTKGMRLLQLLMRHRLIESSDFTRIYQIQQTLTFACSRCHSQVVYNKLISRQSFKCPRCQRNLQEPPHLATIILPDTLKEKLRKCILLGVLHSGSGTNWSVEPSAAPATSHKKALSEPTAVARPTALKPVAAINPIGGQSFGDYELIDEIARGGMGVVYRARHKVTDQVVALKMMRQIDITDPEQLKRFEREIQAAGSLNHPNIVSIHEVGKYSDIPFFTMDLIEGASLARRLHESPPDVMESVHLIKLIAQAIDYAHGKGIIHRDLKPANILLDIHGQPQITDFGLAKNLNQSSQLTRTGAALGTPHYMAPEQARGKLHEISPATDVYALGTLLYQMVTGRLPFDADSAVALYAKIEKQEPSRPRSINPTIPRDLETIILKAMAKRPADRYHSALALAEDLERLERGEPIMARRSWRQCLERLGRRSRHLLAPLVAVVLTTIVIGLVALYLHHQQQRPPTSDHELQIALHKLKVLQQKQDWHGIVAITRLMIATYGERVLPCYLQQAEALLALQKYRPALQALGTLYLRAKQPQDEIQALRALTRTFLAAGEVQQAAKVMERWQTQSMPPQDRILQARIYMELGEFTEAANVLRQRSAPPRASVANSDLAHLTRRGLAGGGQGLPPGWRKWLQALQPCARIAWPTEGSALVDLENNGKMALVAWQKRLLRIYQYQRHGKWRCTYEVAAKKNCIFRGPVVTLDINGNGRPLLIIGSENTLTHKWSLEWLARQGTHLSYDFYTKLQVGLRSLWAGDLDEDGRKDLILLYQGYGYNPDMFHFIDKEYYLIRALPQGVSTNLPTAVVALATYDFNDDHISEIIMGRSLWGGQDLAIYAYWPSRSMVHLLQRTKLGVITGCQAADFDLDGKAEIVVSLAAHPLDKKQPGGLAILKYHSEQNLEDHWQYRLENSPATVDHLILGQCGHGLGVVAVAICQQARCLQPAVMNNWVLLLYRLQNHYTVFRFTLRHTAPRECHLGDVDGDGIGELVVTSPTHIFIYGADD